MSVLRVYTDHDVTNLLFTTDNKLPHEQRFKSTVRVQMVVL